MQIKFWGVRGSIPAPLSNNEYKKKIRDILQLYNKSEKPDIDSFLQTLSPNLSKTIGGNTSCISIIENNICIILDAGSGIRELSYDLLANYPEINEFHIFFSHLHWDHIIGLPFFVPIYVDNKKIFFYNDKTELQSSIKTIFSYPFFPVEYNFFADKFFCNQIDIKDIIEIGSLKISFLKALHPGGCINIKVENQNNKKFVYATDTEYKELDSENLDSTYNFFNSADVLVFDAQYTFSEALTTKKDWGHSSNMVGIDIAISSNVKNIIFFHHEPSYNDNKINEILTQSVKYKNINNKENELHIEVAYEGMKLNI